MREVRCPPAHRLYAFGKSASSLRFFPGWHIPVRPTCKARGPRGVTCRLAERKREKASDGLQIFVWQVLMHPDTLYRSCDTGHSVAYWYTNPGIQPHARTCGLQEFSPKAHREPSHSSMQDVCPGSSASDGIVDTAYGGGDLVLSALAAARTLA